MEIENMDEELYLGISTFAGDILNGKKNYLVLESLEFDKLVVEKINSNEYSIAHYLSLNGDSIKSPEITFKINNKTLEITSYLDDYVSNYISYDDLKSSSKILEDLKLFFKDWLKNIKENFSIEVENLKNTNLLSDNFSDINPIDNDIDNSSDFIPSVDNSDSIDDNTHKYDEINRLKELYPPGSLIRLEHMENESLPIGLIGFVKCVDDIGQIKVIWQNGSTLSLNENDKFQKIEIKNLPLESKEKISKLKEKILNISGVKTNKIEKVLPSKQKFNNL